MNPIKANKILFNIHNCSVSLDLNNGVDLNEHWKPVFLSERERVRCVKLFLAERSQKRLGCTRALDSGSDVEIERRFLTQSRESQPRGARRGRWTAGAYRLMQQAGHSHF